MWQSIQMELQFLPFKLTTFSGSNTFLNNEVFGSNWVFPQLNISLRVQVLIPGFLLTFLITYLLKVLLVVSGLQKYTVSNLIAMCLFSLGMIKAYDMDFVVRVLAGSK